jgi:hypothetical protein
MALAKLSSADRRVLFECLTAAAKGPFFTDADLSILFGVTRDDLLRIVARIPWLDDSEPTVRRAIGGAFNNLLRYPHGNNANWRDWISVGPVNVEQIEQRWWCLQPPIEYASLEIRGPAFIDGSLYRVIAYCIRGGGHGQTTQVWKGDKWVASSEGPGCKAVEAAPRAGEQELRRAGVDISPLSPGYDPLAFSDEQ